MYCCTLNEINSTRYVTLHSMNNSLQQIYIYAATQSEKSQIYCYNLKNPFHHLNQKHTFIQLYFKFYIRKCRIDCTYSFMCCIACNFTCGFICDLQAANGDYHQTFEVNNRTGQIVLQKALDYEVLSFYHYNVSARVGKSA